MTDEIRRVVPIYRGVAIGSPDADGIWDRKFSRLERQPGESASAVTMPVPTLHLDLLEARFQHRFDERMQAAQEARGEQQVFSV